MAPTHTHITTQWPHAVPYGCTPREWTRLPESGLEQKQQLATASETLPRGEQRRSGKQHLL
eukprot:4202587-Alexandrium_andersonii.AAC.1